MTPTSTGIAGGRDYGPDEARQYARWLGVTPEWLLTGYSPTKDERVDEPQATTLRVVGYVGAGAHVHVYEIEPDYLEQIEARLLATASTVALEMRDSDLGIELTAGLSCTRMMIGGAAARRGQGFHPTFRKP